MAMRKTPFLRLRYPWASDTVNAADVQSMAADFDQALIQTQQQAAAFSRMSSVCVQRQGAAQSVTKGALTTITFDTVVLNNGVDSPLANGSWYSSANPTRLTAPSACVVFVTAFAGLNLTAAFGTTGCIQQTIALNGATGGTGVQGSKYGPYSTATGQQWVSASAMWSLNAGDYLEQKIYWTGTPAGPLNTDTVFQPTMNLMMLAIPAVP